MNPRAETLLNQWYRTRPSLGYPGDCLEMGLEAIEQIEVICAELCAEVFQARRNCVPSGAIKTYMHSWPCVSLGMILLSPCLNRGACDAPSGGLCGVIRPNIHHAPVLADGYTVDVDALAKLAQEVRPKLITIGGSLNLAPHPVQQIAEIMKGIGAKTLFDAAHQCGIIAVRMITPVPRGRHHDDEHL